MKTLEQQDQEAFEKEYKKGGAIWTTDKGLWNAALQYERNRTKITPNQALIMERRESEIRGKDAMIKEAQKTIVALAEPIERMKKAAKSLPLILLAKRVLETHSDQIKAARSALEGE